MHHQLEKCTRRTVMNIHCQSGGKLSSEITQGSGSIHWFFLTTWLPESVHLFNLQGVPSWARLQRGWSVQLLSKCPCSIGEILWKKRGAASVKCKFQKQRSSGKAPRKPVVMRGFLSPSNALPAEHKNKWGKQCVCGAKVLALLLLTVKQ